MLYVGGIFGLAVTIGFFAVFAPSGIGVREANKSHALKSMAFVKIDSI